MPVLHKLNGGQQVKGFAGKLFAVGTPANCIKGLQGKQLKLRGGRQSSVLPSTAQGQGRFGPSPCLALGTISPGRGCNVLLFPFSSTVNQATDLLI